MTNTSKTINSRCDQCANKNIKVHRRYKDESYCANCYNTWFIKKPCNQCGELKRLHKKERFAVCTDCQRRQPCIRCGREAIKDGANTEYGRVCQTCYQGHFKSKKVCFECGKLKRNISRYSKLSHDQAVCESCYQNYFMETCSLCHKYRELVDTEQGRICKKCDEFGEVPCQSCNKLMPAGMGKHCQDCYWSKRLLHETNLNTYLLTSSEIKKAYSDFIEWFADSKGSMVAALKHNKFVYFFIQCDEIWHKIPSYESLVQEFKPNGLREYLTVLRWLILTEQITIDASVKEQVAEQERIANLLAKFDDKIPRCINEYHKFLDQKLLNGKTSLKSVRLALQPAVGLCIEYQVKGSNRPSQEHIDNYLLIKHGQYSALYGFVTFLNKNYHLSLVCRKPSKDKILKTNRREVEKRMIVLYQRPKPLSIKDKSRWLQLAMIYFHGVDMNLKTLASLETKDIIVNEEHAVVIRLKDGEYTIPSP